MKKIAMSAVVGGLIGVMTSSAQAHCGMCPGDSPAAKKEVKETPGKSTNVVMQTTCPVMGGKIDRKVFVDHKGKRVYLCCAGCIAVAKADPEKYIKKLEAEGIVLDKTPTGTTTNAPAATPRTAHEEHGGREHGAHHH